MEMGIDTTSAADATDLLVVALGLSEEEMAGLRHLAGMHGGDPVEFVRGLVLTQLEFARTCSPAATDVEVVVRDFTR